MRLGRELFGVGLGDLAILIIDAQRYSSLLPLPTSATLSLVIPKYKLEVITNFTFWTFDIESSRNLVMACGRRRRDALMIPNCV